MGGYTFDRQSLSINSAYSFAPGSYIFSTEGQELKTVERLGEPARLEGRGILQLSYLPIVKGEVVRKVGTAVRVRFDRPLTLGGARVDLAPEEYRVVSKPSRPGFLEAAGPWSRRPTGLLMWVMPGKVRVTNAADGVPQDVELAEGELRELILPTATVKSQVERGGLDSYPTASCAAAVPKVRVLGAEALALRHVDSTNVYLPMDPVTVPAGPLAKVYGYSLGVAQAWETHPGEVVTVKFHRLEVTNGPYDVEFWNGSKWITTGCSGLKARTGLDVVDGRYRVTVKNASGTAVEEVTFP